MTPANATTTARFGSFRRPPTPCGRKNPKKIAYMTLKFLTLLLLHPAP